MSTSSTPDPTPSLEAKIVVLGAQGVGKTSLVHRYVKSAFTPAQTQSTVGASFLTKRVHDSETGTTVRLQIWDTAGQERFRSISKLYYRGANAAVLCYDITDEATFTEMGRWLDELRANLSHDTILHVVGTKADIAATHPEKRKVPYERSIAYVAENMHPAGGSGGGARTGGDNTRATTPNAERLFANSMVPSAAQAAHGGGQNTGVNGHQNRAPLPTPRSERSSGLWAHDYAWTWTSCHEVSASTGEGIDEVFRVITRRLVEQHNQRVAGEMAAMATPGAEGQDGYFNSLGSAHSGLSGGANGGSFRVGYGDKRRSWLGLPTFGGDGPHAGEGDEVRTWQDEVEGRRSKRGGKCC